MTSTVVSRKALDPNVLPFAVDRYGKWVSVRLTGIENPHILVVGGSQTGKTTTEKVIAAVAASRGNIVIMIDPKHRFTKVFRDPKTRAGLPHVPVYRSSNPDTLVQEAEAVLAALINEMQRRYDLDADSPTNILRDQERFPTILIVADEIGVLFELADKEWPHRKPEGYKGDTPLREHWHTLMRMGAEARLICMAANQTAAADEMPAGTKTRKLCGHRIVLGNTRDRNEWPMIAGDGMAKPEVPDGQQGAGVILIGTNSPPNRIQCTNIDTDSDPGAAYRLAAQGVEILESQGHIRGGQLYLGDVPLPRPGRTGGQVARLALPSPRSERPVPAAETAADEALEQRTTALPQDRNCGVTAPVSASPAEPVMPIVGNPDGAEFCGMSVRNFRRARADYPIPGEFKVGNAPAWHEPDLKEWSMQRADDRQDRTEKGA